MAAESQMMMMKKKNKPHLVMFPYLAQGHIIPFIELSKLLARRTGFAITLVNTPLNIRRLEPKIASLRQAESLDIRLAALPFDGTGYGLPPNTETPESLTHALFLSLVQASQQLQQPFLQLLQNIAQQEGRFPLCIISDMFLGWTLDVAKSLGIPRLVFCTGGAYGISIYYSLWLHLTHRQTGSDTFCLPDLPHIRLHRSQLPWNIEASDGSDPWFFIWKHNISCNLSSWGTIFNTFEDLEHDFLDHFRRITGSPVWPVGPILPLTPTHKAKEIASRGNESVVDEEICLQWLDSHPVSSVLYISFGSQNSISVSQMRELSFGLEASQQAFVWALRPPVGTAELSSDHLPHGFEERMRANNKGFLIRGWAPQLFILAHPSTGGFLSHCGWNSIMESISHGVPIIGWPIASEQFFNSKLIEEEVGVGVEVCRGNDGEISKEKIERFVKMLLDGSDERGIGLRKRALDLKQKASRAVSCGGSSMTNVDDLIQKLKNQSAMENHF
eukprot:Gb_19142 [translate_table: standard]